MLDIASLIGLLALPLVVKEQIGPWEKNLQVQAPLSYSYY